MREIFQNKRVYRRMKKMSYYKIIYRMNLMKKTPAIQKLQRLHLEEVKSGRKCLQRKKSKKLNF